MRLVIRNACYLDTSSMAFSEAGAIVVEDGRVADIASTATARDGEVIDARGKYVLPGLIDSHVHFRLATMNFEKLATWSEVEYGIVMARLSKETLSRGFTSVRDLGGDVEGLIRAIRAGAAHRKGRTDAHPDRWSR